MATPTTFPARVSLSLVIPWMENTGAPQALIEHAKRGLRELRELDTRGRTAAGDCPCAAWARCADPDPYDPNGDVLHHTSCEHHPV